MTTLREIESAAERLPLPEKEALLKHLAHSLREQRMGTPPLPRVFPTQEIQNWVAEDEADMARLRPAG